MSPQKRGKVYKLIRSLFCYFLLTETNDLNFSFEGNITNVNLQVGTLLNTGIAWGGNE
jgi:hypothetical protein